MLAYYDLPLRQSLTDVRRPVQLDVVEEAKLLLEGFAGVKIENPARLLTLRALAERDLDAARSLLGAALPGLRAGPVEVVYLEGGRLEPYARLHLRTPAEFSALITGELKRRRGSIDELAAEAGYRLFISMAPLRQLLGLDGWLSETTRGAALAQYRFEDYRLRAAD